MLKILFAFLVLQIYIYFTRSPENLKVYVDFLQYFLLFYYADIRQVHYFDTSAVNVATGYHGVFVLPDLIIASFIRTVCTKIFCHCQFLFYAIPHR